MIKLDKQEDVLFLQRLEDLALRCRERYTPEFTHFLDGRALRIAKDYLSGYKDDVLVVTFGGFDNAERQVVGLFPKDVYGYEGFEEKSLFEMFEICGVVIDGSGFSSFSHRDVMGSVLGLGIKRETVGDIFVTDDGHKAYICLDKVTGEYIRTNLEFVSRDKVKVSVTEPCMLPKIEKKFSVITGTVASERLDCLVAMMINISREKAKLLITGGLVSVNHFEELKCDANLCEDDVISIRGYGRFILKEFGGVTRKGRNRVVVHKMI